MLVRDFKTSGIIYYKDNKLCSPNENDVIERIEMDKYNLLIYLSENIHNMSLIDIQKRCGGKCVDCTLSKQCPFKNFSFNLKPCKWKLN